MFQAIYNAFTRYKPKAVRGKFTVIAHHPGKDFAPTLNAGWQEMEGDNFPSSLLIGFTRAEMEKEARKIVPPGTPYDVVEVE